MTPSAFNLKRGYSLHSPSDRAVEAGEQLFLTYGAHPNRTLFVEYGFVEHWRSQDLEVDVQDIFEEMIKARGATADWLRQTLEDAGYWGFASLHFGPLEY